MKQKNMLQTKEWPVNVSISLSCITGLPTQSLRGPKGTKVALGPHRAIMGLMWTVF